VTIGVVEHGERLIFTYGTAKPDSVFEIGSITKTFTGLILAQMVEQGLVRLDEPVRELLPPKTAAKPASGAEVSFLTLAINTRDYRACQTIFIPHIPKTPMPTMTRSCLYEYIAKHGLVLSSNTPFGYSNLGLGCLGNRLPIGLGFPIRSFYRAGHWSSHMNETAIVLTSQMQARFNSGL